MKEVTWAVCGVAAGYLLAPFIKKVVDWAKNGLVSLKNKLDEAAKDEEVPTPEEEEVQPVDPDED